jgi:2-hydroxychromene-2-carboxylate isomerase
LEWHERRFEARRGVSAPLRKRGMRGGNKIGGTKLKVELMYYDYQSTTPKVVRLAEELILGRGRQKRKRSQMIEAEPRVEYFFSFISLWSYIGSLVFQDIISQHDLRVDFKPIDLLAIFAAGGSKPVRERSPQRQAYRLVEMERWKRIRNIPLVTWPKFYPADPTLGHRMVLAAASEGKNVTAFAHAGLRAVWADELNVEDEATLVDLANGSGLDGHRLLARAQLQPELAARESELTREAIDRQLFGAPFYFYRGEPFWGQDRLDQLEAAIVTKRAPILPPTTL